MTSYEIIYAALVLAHIVGTALGVGGATISDWMFVRTVKNRRLTAAELGFLDALSKAVWAGALLLGISGLLLILAMYLNGGGKLPPIMFSEPFRAKLTLVVIILINGLVFKRRVFPILSKSVEQPELLQSSTGILSVTGAISVASWYMVVFISVFHELRFPYEIWMGIYAAILVGAALSARLVLRLLLRKGHGLKP